MLKQDKQPYACHVFVCANDRAGARPSCADHNSPPRHFQWIADQRFSRSHDHLASTSAVVSAGGRLFSIVDEGSIAFAAAAPSLPMDCCWWQLKTTTPCTHWTPLPAGPDGPLPPALGLTSRQPSIPDVYS